MNKILNLIFMLIFIRSYKPRDNITKLNLSNKIDKNEKLKVKENYKLPKRNEVNNERI